MIVTKEDILFIAVIVILILISVYILIRINIKEKNMDTTIKKAKKDMIDLEAITKNIEKGYRPLNIELTTYEKEQENNAIISYDELVNSKDNHNVNYEEYQNDGNIDVKKVDLNESATSSIPDQKIDVDLMKYEKEEAFLKALKQLQSDLAR